jgi:hypothetical protein
LVLGSAIIVSDSNTNLMRSLRHCEKMRGSAFFIFWIIQTVEKRGEFRIFGWIFLSVKIELGISEFTTYKKFLFSYV